MNDKDTKLIEKAYKKIKQKIFDREDEKTVEAHKKQRQGKTYAQRKKEFADIKEESVYRKVRMWKPKRPTDLSKGVFVTRDQVQKILDDDKLREQFKAMQDAKRLYVKHFVEEYEFFYNPKDYEVFKLLWQAGITKPAYSPTPGVGDHNLSRKQQRELYGRPSKGIAK